MACVKNIPRLHGESEMEEGEIVDDLSDISSEEEYLMRSRLEILEKYNNVLERKKAKNPSFVPGKVVRITGKTKGDIILPSKESSFVYKREVINDSSHKPQHRPKKKKVVEAQPYGTARVKDHKKKTHRRKKLQVKIISESSEESDDEYRNKRRRLADAVIYKSKHVDKSSLHDRLQRMLGNKIENVNKTDAIQNKDFEVTEIEIIDSPVEKEPDEPKSDAPVPATDVLKDTLKSVTPPKPSNMHLLVDLICSDDDRGKDIFEIEESSQEDILIAENVIKDKSETQEKNVNNESDEDLELLREHALKSKAAKVTTDQKNNQSTHNNDSQQAEKPVETETSNPDSKKPASEDEDSDTAELRMICLKSAMLKKAIEMKKKQKLRKRLSQSSIHDQDGFDEYRELENRLQSDNNTDRESVDMDMGSDADEKTKEASDDHNKVAITENVNKQQKETTGNETEIPKPKEDELEEDEDLLRAKLLTSLSKNLPNLVNPNVVETIDKVEKGRETTPPVPKIKVPETRLVINVGESDSEGENEATKNLTKMHAKLSEDFQQKLEELLKSKRTEVETTTPEVPVPKPVVKPTEKYLPKTVDHLPKSEQMEYKYLVKRMAELQKMKEARQLSMNATHHALGKDTLKPRNVTVNTFVSVNKIEEQIAISRKKIAEESSRILRLKEEATKLMQKFKIVSTELKNISTAINLNKKEQRNSQNRLSKIKLEHYRLSSLSKHTKPNGNLITNSNSLPMNKLQKENHPAKEDIKNTDLLKSVKVCVPNDRLQDSIAPPARLSVQVDFSSNKKTVIMPNVIEKPTTVEKEVHKSPEKLNPIERHVEIIVENTVNVESTKDSTDVPVFDEMHQKDPTVPQLVEKDEEIEENPVTKPKRRKEFDDYESPLQALDSANWEADPNAIMCPFEVGGNCKDRDCKYFHPKPLPTQ